MNSYDPLTDDEMGELVENPMLVHLYDAHRLVAALVKGREIERAVRRIASSFGTGDQDEEETGFWFAVNDALAALGDEVPVGSSD